MGKVESNSVALVVTSPPYFAGKEYERSLGQNGVPGTYFEYLDLLHDVFEECKRVLEPGGRIAVNVANLGRRPYRSLAGDVTEILQDLGLLLRGEVVWWKGRAAGGSCAWGTFQRPNNPVLRDVTERIVIASKGRFDRALKPQQRLQLGLPSTATISRDEFLEATTDLWEMAPESATRVGHPAPYPVELPKRLIELYTYEDDVVLDPFMGSGTTAVAALADIPTLHRLRHGQVLRHPGERPHQPRRRRALRQPEDLATTPYRVSIPATRSTDAALDFPGRAAVEGRQAKDFAQHAAWSCEFVDIRADVKFSAAGHRAQLPCRRPDGTRMGIRRVRCILRRARAGLETKRHTLEGARQGSRPPRGTQDLPLVLLTTDAPARGSAGCSRPGCAPQSRRTRLRPGGTPRHGRP